MTLPDDVVERWQETAMDATQMYVSTKMVRAVLEAARYGEMRTALSKVLDYYEGRKPYDFHRLPHDERANEAFDAWQVIAHDAHALLSTIGDPTDIGASHEL